MAALVPDPETGLLVLAPDDQTPVDITQLKTIGPWEGTLTVLPLPPAPGLWLSAPGCTFALGTDVVIVIAGQEYPAVVVGRSPDDEGGVYQVALQETAGPLQR